MEKSDSPTLVASQNTPNQRTVTVTINRTDTAPVDILEQRTWLFRQQEKAVNRFYATLFSDNHVHSEQLFYLTEKKPHFVETQKLAHATYLNARDVAGLEQLELLSNTLHVVDDLLLNLVQTMPAQRPVGWQLYSLGQNLLNLPTTTPVRSAKEHRRIESSLASTILQFFGVACFSGDKGYFIGHVLGYLFCCYYFAHLSVNYSVTPLKEVIASQYPYQWVEVPELVRLLQETNETHKAQIYQLALYAAQISEYAIDKRIEKMLITEVNSFNKQDYREELASFVSVNNADKATLFQPVKPLK